jgi:hypothetical protein
MFSVISEDFGLFLGLEGSDGSDLAKTRVHNDSIIGFVCFSTLLAFFFLL